MPRVTVWKCPHTGKLFEDKTKYQTHLGRLSRERRERRRIQADRAQAQAWWLQLQQQEFDIMDLPALVLDHQDRFWTEAARVEPWHWENIGKSRRGVVCPVPTLLEFTRFEIHWSDSVSNTHDCPHNGVTNWGGRNKLEDGTPAPRGYPGWSGRVEWIVRWPREWDGWYPGSDLFSGKPVRIHTGTGGGGMIDSQRYGCTVQTFGYDAKIFAADWPGMTRFHEKAKMWNTLKQVSYQRHG
jgi:hypothetical protein